MNPILLDIPVPITTPRLLLRPSVAGDGPGINEAVLESYDELHPWMPWADHRPTVEEGEENARRSHAKWILREDLRLLIIDRASERILGSTGLHRINWELPSFEIGYWLRTSYVGKGYATEATNALTRFAFEHFGAKRVELRCNPENEMSLAIFKRLGFEFEGCLRNSNTHANPQLVKSRDTLIYSRINADGLPPLDVSWAR
ncbi:MAG: GNAT family N-acetyltransferase [Bdellovibrionota bacterium]